MCSQNAENAISETQISKIFRGHMPPDPPRRLVPSALAPPIFRQVSATAFLCSDIFDTNEESGEEIQGVPALTVNHVPATLSNDTPSMATDILTSTDATPGHSASAPIIIHPDETVLDTPEKTVDDVVAELIRYCSANDISNPVEILSCYQSMFVQGRALEIKDPSVCEEGDTNVIFIDRGNVLDTGFDEVDQIQNLRTTLEIEFYGEVLQA